MIIKKEWFIYEIELDDPSKATISPKDYENFPFNTKTGGSYNVAPARVLGLSYPDYLRFLLIMFPDDVEIIGKNKLYPKVLWKRNKMMFQFIRLLNVKLSLAMGLMEYV